MIRFPITGASYVDARPDGEYAALVVGASSLLTRAGTIPLPAADDWPLFVRVSPIGPLQIAGQGQKTGAAWHWTGTQWIAHGPACGVSPVIFDYAGALHVSDCSIGSQGWRYVDRATGHLVTGDATYGPLHGLNEYTDLGDGVLIGQSNQMEGLMLWDGSHLRLLEGGNCRFVRALRDGDAVAVSCWKGGVGAIIWWLSWAELLALPLVAVDPPVHPPPPVDPPKPPDPPKEPPVSVPDYSSFVLSLPLPLAELGRLNDIADATRAAKGEDHPDTQAAEGAVNQLKGTCCERIVAALNAHEGAQRWGLLSKTGGQRWIRSDGENLSTDIAFCPSLGRLVDVMADRGPSWDVHPPEDVQPASKFRLPLASAPPVDPPVDPPKPPPPSADSVTHAELAALRTALEAQIADAKATADAARAAVAALPPPQNVNLAGYAKKGDRVTVSGRDLVGITRTWGGTIDK